MTTLFSRNSLKLIIVSGAAVILLTPLFGLAADFSLSPGKVEVEMLPGTSLTKTITVVNNGDEPAAFKVLVTAMPGRESGEVANAHSAVNFLTVTETAFSLEGNEVRQLPITVTVPATALPQSYHAAIFIEGSGQSGQAKSALRLGSLIFVRVAGERKEVGQISQFLVLGGPLATPASNVNVAVTFDNSGNTYLNPYGFILINNWRGRNIGYAKIDPWYVLPGQSKTKDLSLKNPGVGLYQFKLVLNRGYNDVVDEQTRFLLVWSWGMAIVASIVILIIGGLLINYFVKRKLRML